MRPGPDVKICCIASLAEARLALDAGARWLGLVSAMPSGPGVIDDHLATQIVRGLPPQTRTVLLTARTTADDIARQHAAIGSHALQLVDRVAPEEGRRLRELCPEVRLFAVIHVVDAGALDEAREAAQWADAVLLDSGNPGLAVKQLGGTGRTHDWSLSRRIREAIAPLPLFLAGGLRPENVDEALRAVQPFGVDVCSGVRQHGALDPGRLSAFMAAVGAAASARRGPPDGDGA